MDHYDKRALHALATAIFSGNTRTCILSPPPYKTLRKGVCDAAVREMVNLESGSIHNGTVGDVHKNIGMDIRPRMVDVYENRILFTNGSVVHLENAHINKLRGTRFDLIVLRHVSDTTTLDLMRQVYPGTAMMRI